MLAVVAPFPGVRVSHLQRVKASKRFDWFSTSVRAEGSGMVRGSTDMTDGIANEAKSVAGNHWLRLSPSVALLRG